MKKIRTLLLSMFLAIGTSAIADNYSYLTIDKNDGETSFSLSEIKKITFEGSNMIITMTDGSTQQLPLASLNKMFFSETGLTAINPANKTNEQIQLIDGIIHVNAPAGSMVTLYAINGQMVKNIAATGEDTQINVSNMTKGIYIVKVGKQAKKIMNK